MAWLAAVAACALRGNFPNLRNPPGLSHPLASEKGQFKARILHSRARSGMGILFTVD